MSIVLIATTVAIALLFLYHIALRIRTKLWVLRRQKGRRTKNGSSSSSIGDSIDAGDGSRIGSIDSNGTGSSIGGGQYFGGMAVDFGSSRGRAKSQAHPRDPALDSGKPSHAYDDEENDGIEMPVMKHGHHSRGRGIPPPPSGPPPTSSLPLARGHNNDSAGLAEISPRQHHLTAEAPSTNPIVTSASIEALAVAAATPVQGGASPPASPTLTAVRVPEKKNFPPPPPAKVASSSPTMIPSTPAAPLPQQHQPQRFSDVTNRMFVDMGSSAFGAAGMSSRLSSMNNDSDFDAHPQPPADDE
jgi:hypothetical protein